MSSSNSSEANTQIMEELFSSFEDNLKNLINSSNLEETMCKKSLKEYMNISGIEETLEEHNFKETMERFLEILKKYFVQEDNLEKTAVIMKIFYLLVKLLKGDRGKIFTDQHKDLILLFLSKIWEIYDKCEEETKQFIKNIEISNEPFIDFLIDGFTDFTPLSKNIRQKISNILCDNQKFKERCISFVKELSEVSPMIPYIKLDLTLLTWIINNNEEVINILDDLDSKPDEIQFYTYYAFILAVKKETSVKNLGRKLLNKEGVFAKKIDDWCQKYKDDMLEIIKSLILMDLKDIMEAFFYVEDFDNTNSSYYFLSVPEEYNSFIDTNQITSNDALLNSLRFEKSLSDSQSEYVQLFSFIPKIIEWYEDIFNLNEDKMKSLIYIIKKLSSSKNLQAHKYFFTQGEQLVTITAEHLNNLEEQSVENKEIFSSFVKNMSNLNEYFKEQT